MTRRELLLFLAAAACSRSQKPAVVQSTSTDSSPVAPKKRACEGVELVSWDVGGVVSRVAILRPKDAVSSRYPVLVALHGHGEAIKGPDRGCLGWPNDYALTRALERLCAPPLTTDDFEGLVTDRHLEEINGALAKTPWRGLVVVCPYLPDLDLRKDAEVLDYGKFVAQTILPRVVREMPVTSGAGATGIDGVSLGGAVALRAGLAMPETFGAVGALQPAIDESRLADWVSLARSARAKRPTLALRLTTSDHDYYRKAVHALADAWRAAAIEHDFSELPGPHDYIFNRGAGAYEMLMWHSRVLG